MFAGLQVVRALPLVAALLLAAPALAQDTDGDGTPDASDNCIEVPNGPTIPDPGLNVQRDTDGDGIGNVCDADLNNDEIVNFLDLGILRSVFFQADEDADLNGDGIVNFLDLGILRSGFFLEPGPSCCGGQLPVLDFASVACEGNLPESPCTIEAAPGVVFRTTRERIDEEDDGQGVRVADDIVLETGAGDLTVFQADLVFRREAPSPPGSSSSLTGSDGLTIGPFDALRGSARVPFPNIGFLEAVEISDPVLAEAGLDLGINIDLGVPLQPDRSYLFFNFESGFSAGFGPISFDLGGPAATLILDPLDPFIFVGGDLLGLFGSDEDPDPDPDPDPMPDPGPGEEDPSASLAGVGLSLQGLIPFVPETTLGIEDVAQSFEGEVLIQGTIPFAPSAPLELVGSVIFGLDPDGNGQTVFGPSEFDPALFAAGNGDLNVAIPFLEFFSFGFPLGSATAAVQIGLSSNEAFFSGVLAPEDPFLPVGLAIPIFPQTSVQVAGFLSAEDFGSSFFDAAGGYGLDPTGLGDLLGLDLEPINLFSASLRVDSAGFLIMGSTGDTIGGGLATGGTTATTAFISSNGLDSFLELTGSLLIGGQGLEDATVRVSPLGATLSGRFDTDLLQIAMLGEIAPAGPTLTGSAGISIPFSTTDALVLAELVALIAEQEAARDVAQDSVDAAQLLFDGRAAELASASSALGSAIAALESAQSEVNSLNSEIASLNASIDSLIAQRTAQQNRSCGAECGSCYSNPGCCGLCEADKAAQITFLTGEIAALETAILAVEAARLTALGALEVAQLALSGAQGTFDAASVAFQAAEDGLNAAEAELDNILALLASLDEQVANLPAFEGDFAATISATLGPAGVGGEVSGSFAGIPVFGGRVDFVAGEACFDAPPPFPAGEFCAPI